VPSSQSPLQGLVAGTTFISTASVASQPSREAAFAWFRASHPSGADLSAVFERAKAALRAETAALAAADRDVEALKAAVEAIAAQVDGRGAAAHTPQQEVSLQRECRARREKCAARVEERAAAAKTVAEARAAAEAAKAALGEAFLRYYQATYAVGGGQAHYGSTGAVTASGDAASLSPGSSDGSGVEDVGEAFEQMLHQTLRQSEPGAEAFYTARKLALEAGASKAPLRRKGAQMMR
jgi:membrane protein involved in colicin uptake